MPQPSLKGMRVAILATDGFEQSELLDPRKALDAAGAETEVISLKNGDIRAWKHKEWGERVHVDRVVGAANPKDYGALLLPGGVMNPDALRMQPPGGEFRARILRRRQARGGDLSRSLDHRGDRCGQGVSHDIVAVAENRYQQRRGQLG